MCNVEKAVDTLITAIQDTTEYREYQEEKKQMKLYPEIFEKLNEFRQKNFILQQTMEGIKLLEETEKLQNEYEEFHSDSRVHDFLAKELAFCRMMQNINYKITESIHFE